MKIHKVTPNADFNNLLYEKAGYHPDDTTNDPYIDSDVVAEITEAQADFLDDTAAELYQMGLAAVDFVIKNNRFADFGIGEDQARLITASWNRHPLPDGSTRDPFLHGRMDIAWSGGTAPGDAKFFEFNADGATSSYECSTVQWIIAQDLMERGELPQGMSQFNSLHETLVERFQYLHGLIAPNISDLMHFTCMTDGEEDLTTTGYLEEIAQEAGWNTHFLDIGNIGVNDQETIFPTVRMPGDDAKIINPHYGKFYDENDTEIKVLYKLMPWEHLFEFEYAKYIAMDHATLFIEPPWTAILANKMLSAVLWELYPGHPALLPTYTTPEPLGGNYVEKPIFGREGDSIRVFFNGEVVDGNKPAEQKYEGFYQQYPKVYQQYHPLPEFAELPGYRIQTGIWVVGDGQVAGMDLRRDKTLVTGGKHTRFLPHVMRPHGFD